MKRLIAIGILLFTLPVLQQTLCGQNGAPYAVAPAPARYAEAAEQARRMAAELMNTTGSPGLSAAVAVEGEIIWSDGFGYGDVENRVPVWPQTRFRIGSVSKSLTSAAVGKLYEQGKLDLDAPVRRYVPSFPDKGQAITTRQLAGHLAGIRHYLGKDFPDNKSYKTVLEGLAIFQNDPLLHLPGTKYAYSSYGWNLVSAVVETASGQDFLGYMEEQVFLPLGMRHTVADHVDKIVYNRTGFYARDGQGKLRNAHYIDSSYKWAGGGFLSTSEDLVRFASALMREGFLKPETTRLLFTTQKTNSGEETGYGIGWRIGKDDKGRRIVHHGGSIEGGRAMLLLYPEFRVAVALLMNLSGARFGEKEAQQLAQPFMSR